MRKILKLLTDKSLMKWYNEAVEMQDKKYLNKLKAEINRRSKEE